MPSTDKWLMALVAACTPLPALAAPHAFLEARMPIAAPYGYTAMCGADPAACAPVTTGVDATSAPKERLLRRVNRHVRQVSDTVRFARRDVWQASGIGRDAAGDCEDIALEKRKLLLAAGVPAERLFLALAYGRSGVGLHLVLIAHRLRRRRARQPRLRHRALDQSALYLDRDPVGWTARSLVQRLIIHSRYDTTSIGRCGRHGCRSSVSQIVTASPSSHIAVRWPARYTDANQPGTRL